MCDSRQDEFLYITFQARISFEDLRTSASPDYFDPRSSDPLKRGVLVVVDSVAYGHELNNISKIFRNQGIPVSLEERSLDTSLTNIYFANRTTEQYHREPQITNEQVEFLLRGCRYDPPAVGYRYEDYPLGSDHLPLNSSAIVMSYQETDSPFCFKYKINVEEYRTVKDHNTEYATPVLDPYFTFFVSRSLEPRTSSAVMHIPIDFRNMFISDEALDNK